MERYAAPTRFLVATGSVLLCTLIAVWSAASASATPLDDDFLDRLDEVGIVYTSPIGTIRYAHGVCRELDLGVPHSRVVELVRYDNPAFDWDAAADYVVLAYMTYCPWNRAT